MKYVSIELLPSWRHLRFIGRNTIGGHLLSGTSAASEAVVEIGMSKGGFVSSRNSHQIHSISRGSATEV